MKKLNRNNADIDKLVNDKVVVKFTSSINELDFRKWFAKYGKVLCIDDVIISEECPKIYYRVLKIKEEYSFDWESTDWYINKGYKVFEWEVVEEQKTYTIRDIVDNKGKLYKDEHDTLYFYDDKLYCRTREEKKFRPSLLNLQQMLDLELTEYKEEPIKITFEDALKEMEQGKVCRSLCSGTEYLLSNNHFEKLNRNYTTLSYKEIKEGWVVIGNKMGGMNNGKVK